MSWADLKTRIQRSKLLQTSALTAAGDAAGKIFPSLRNPPAALPATASGRPDSTPSPAAAHLVHPKWRTPRGPLSQFSPGYLTRGAGQEPPARAMLYASIDIETTGLDPRTDRICEIAIVRFSGDGHIVSEYSTLINPQRKIGATEIHGLTDDDVAGAPTFAQVADEIARHLAGAVIVAHNLEFEDRFMAAEFSRARYPAPRWPGICTMVTVRAQMDGRSYKLAPVYRTMTGEWPRGQHASLSDARSAAIVLYRLIETAPAPLRYYGPQPTASVGLPDAVGSPTRSRFRAHPDAPVAVRLTEHVKGFQPSTGGRAAQALPLRGWRIGYIPGSAATDEVVELATSNGATIAKRLTKTVRVVVTDHPRAGGAQLDLARQLGLHIRTPAQASRELHAAIEKGLAEQARQEQQERERAAEDAAWRHRWRSSEEHPAWGFGTKSVHVRLR